MQVTFLGTSSGVPTRNRNVSAMALRLPQRSELWLFDCGEATQHQFFRSDLRLSQLKKIFITHMHGDHIFGLPGLLASIGLAGNSSGINLYGPKPLKDFIYGVLKSSSSKISYPINIFPIEEAAYNRNLLLEDDDLLVHCIPLEHRVPAFAYRVDQKPKPGRFNLELAQKLRIPPGPDYAALQRGEVVTLKDGRIFNGKEFTGPSRDGLSMVYCTDTVFTENAIEIAKGADLLIHEATFAHKDADLAYQRAHSTSTMAAQIASEANVGQLALTHLSPRYAPNNEITPNDLLNEAKAIFPNTLLAKDFLQLDVKKRCNSS
ncbi:ribonuclease Z [Prochlorococcus sp. MIT 1223]|uniref:ribonuclease Z n=1 Tax=Prochlorococcus sp. MIT 1223 TaxID=3096217 RepID=UPI002A759A50|nr:ribonuclease Z [Prochlorococcus sp. MIT 1223]